MSQSDLQEQLRAAHARIAELERTQEKPQRANGLPDDVSFLSLLDDAPDVLFVIDVETAAFLETNQTACRRLQYTRDELLSMKGPDIEAILPDDFQWQAHMHHLQQVREITLEGGHKRKDGTTFPVEVRTNFVEHASGNYLVTVVRDISQRHEIQSKVADLQTTLREASRRAGMAEVVAGLLHNVGNVLNSVNATTELMLDGLQGSRLPKLQKALGVLQDQGDDIAGFLASERGAATLTYLHKLSDALAEQHQQQVERMHSLRKHLKHMHNIISVQQAYVFREEAQEVVHVHQLLTDALELNRSSIERHAIDVSLDVDDLPPVQLDKHKVMQILINLLTNARAALRDSGRDDRRLRLRATRSGDSAFEIHIADNGIGIPEALRDKIFQLGFTTKAVGHGFGLHLSAVAAEEMGGSLTCASDGPDTGAEFTLRLPLRVQQPTSGDD